MRGIPDWLRVGRKVRQIGTGKEMYIIGRRGDSYWRIQYSTGNQHEWPVEYLVKNFEPVIDEDEQTGKVQACCTKEGCMRALYQDGLCIDHFIEVQTPQKIVVPELTEVIVEREEVKMLTVKERRKEFQSRLDAGYYEVDVRFIANALRGDYEANRKKVLKALHNDKIMIPENLDIKGLTLYLLADIINAGNKDTESYKKALKSEPRLKPYHGAPTTLLKTGRLPWDIDYVKQKYAERAAKTRAEKRAVKVGKKRKGKKSVPVTFTALEKEEQELRERLARVVSEKKKAKDTIFENLQLKSAELIDLALSLGFVSGWKSTMHKGYAVVIKKG